MFKYFFIIFSFAFFSNNILSQTNKNSKSQIKSLGEPSIETTKELVVAKAHISKSKELSPPRTNDLYGELKRLNGALQKYQVDLRSIDKFISEMDLMAMPSLNAKELFRMQPENFKLLTDKYFESVTAILNYSAKLCLKASKK